MTLRNLWARLGLDDHRSNLGSKVSGAPPEPAKANSDFTADAVAADAVAADAVAPESVVAPILQLLKNGQQDEACRLATLLVRLTPHKPAMHMRWVRQLRCHKEFDLALALCNACFSVDGDDPEIRLNRGYLLYERVQYDQAAEDLEIAGNASPNTIEERLIAASARKRLGQGSQASQSDLMRGFFDPAEATFAARQFDPSAIMRSLNRYGCAWIKGLFHTHELAAFDRVIWENVTDMNRVYDDLGLPGSYDFVGFPLYFAGTNDRQKCQDTYRKSYPAMFNPDLMIGVDNESLPAFVFANLERTGLAQVIRKYLGMERLFVSAAACHIRLMRPQGERAFGEFHQDNRLYNSDAEILTIWFPFRYRHGPMPSLEFLPVRSASHFPCISQCGIDNEILSPDLFWRPAYELGDAVLLSGFNPHRTYFEPEMTLDRTSIDFRIFASPLPAPIYERVVD